MHAGGGSAVHRAWLGLHPVRILSQVAYGRQPHRGRSADTLIRPRHYLAGHRGAASGRASCVVFCTTVMAAGRRRPANAIKQSPLRSFVGAFARLKSTSLVGVESRLDRTNSRTVVGSQTTCALGRNGAGLVAPSIRSSPLQDCSSSLSGWRAVSSGGRPLSTVTVASEEASATRSAHQYHRVPVHAEATESSRRLHAATARGGGPRRRSKPTPTPCGGMEAKRRWSP